MTHIVEAYSSSDDEECGGRFVGSELSGGACGARVDLFCLVVGGSLILDMGKRGEFP